MSTPENESAEAQHDVPPAQTHDAPAADTGEADPPEADRSETPSEPPSPEEARIADLEATLAKAQDDAQQAQARLRTVSKAFTELQAEFKSFRERQESLREAQKRDQAFSLAKTFFDPVMNLKRSLQTVADAPEDEPFVNGVKMVHHQFMEALHKLGFEEVPGEGAMFDPKMHEALAVTPVTEPAQDGRILAVHAVGYAVNGQVLQPAQVVVGKLQATEGEA